MQCGPIAEQLHYLWNNIAYSTMVTMVGHKSHFGLTHRHPISLPHRHDGAARGCLLLNTLRQRQNGRHFPDDILKWVFLNENVWISINISLKIVPMGPIDNIPALVQIMVWRRPGDKPLSEPMMVSLLMHICVTRPQWVKGVSVAQHSFDQWSILLQKSIQVQLNHHWSLMMV